MSKRFWHAAKPASVDTPRRSLGCQPARARKTSPGEIRGGIGDNVTPDDAEPVIGRILEENARLRGLVVTPSNVILKSVADRK
jgi:hypothetical protein